MDKRYKIFGAKYTLSEKLMENPSYAPSTTKQPPYWPDEISAKPKVFHVEITQGKKRVAFLTRKTYDEAKAIGEKYCYGNEHQA